MSNSTVNSYLSTAVSEISISTVVYYRQLSLPDVEALSNIIDTALFKVYMIINDALIGPLLRVQNNCDMSICESLLKSQNVRYEFFYIINYIINNIIYILIINNIY